MKKRLFGLTFLYVVSFLVFIQAADAAKLTIDPNTIVKKPAAVLPIEDKRLDQKVTFEATNVRLNAALEELSKQTGVVIRSGDGKGDWQSRDVPVDICANNVPLGKLLQYIADSTHMLLSTCKTDNIVYYKIWRDAASKKEIDDYLKKDKDSRLARVKWEWDALIKLSQTPDSQIDKRKAASNDFCVEVAKDLGGVLASIDSDTKDSIISGEKIKLVMKDVPKSQYALLEKLYKDAWQKQLLEDAKNNDEMQDEPSAPTDDSDADENNDDTGEVSLPDEPPSAEEEADQTILTDDDIKSASLEFNCDSEGNMGVYFQDSKFCGVDEYNNAEAISRFVKDFPKYEDNLEPPEFKCSDGMVPLDDVIKIPSLQAKIKVDVPKENHNFKFNDLISLISKASGFSFLCEDYVSHKEKDDSYIYYSDITGKELSIRDILTTLSQTPLVNDLYIDQTNKLILGVSCNWCKNYANLVPESLITSLKKKMDNEGLELDDVVPLTELNDGQINDWINEIQGLGMTAETFGDAKPLWQIYDSFSTQKKNMAKSDEGVSLAGINSKKLGKIFEKISKQLAGMSKEDRLSNEIASNPELLLQISNDIKTNYPSYSSHDVNNEKVDKELINKYYALLPKPDILTNANLLSNLSMHIKNMSMYDIYNAMPVNGQDEMKNMPTYYLNKHFYSLVIKNGDQRIYGSNSFDLQFPIYSPKRESELIKESKQSFDQNPNDDGQ